MYSVVPQGPLDLIPLSDKTRIHGKVATFVSCLQDVHQAVHDNLLKAASKYKQAVDKKRHHIEFDVGDYVWAVLTKDRFPVGEYNKLSAKKIELMEIVKKINSNAYLLKLPSHIWTTDVFNVKHLVLFAGDSSDDSDSMPNSVHPRENDVGIEEQAIRFLEKWKKLK